MKDPTAQDALRSTIAPADGLQVPPPQRPWTLPAPWTRGRAHRALENGGPFPTAPTAILVLMIRSDPRENTTARPHPRAVTGPRPSRSSLRSPASFSLTLHRQK